MSGTSADAAGLEPANPSVNGRTRYLFAPHINIFFMGKKLHPPIAYSHSHMLNGAYGNRTRHLLLAKQASPHCDLYPIFAGSIPAGIFNLPAIHLFNPVFKLNGNFIRISGLVRCIWKMSHLNNLSLFLMPSFTLLTFLFIPVFCPANIAFPKCSLFHFFCSFSRMFFSLHLQYARIFKNAKFFANYFFSGIFMHFWPLRSAKNQTKPIAAYLCQQKKSSGR